MSFLMNLEMIKFEVVEPWRTTKHSVAKKIIFFSNWLYSHSPYLLYDPVQHSDWRNL